MEYQVLLLIVMISYMSLLILWGIYQRRQVKTNVDFAIAGRNFMNDELGFGQQYTFSAKPGLSTCLKFVLINYIGFYETDKPSKTYYINKKSD